MVLQFSAKNTTVLVQNNIIQWYFFVGVFCCKKTNKKNTRIKYTSYESFLQSEQKTFVVQFFLELKVTVFGPRFGRL